MYEIYDKLDGSDNQDSLFSLKVIGLAESLSSARWLQHYAQGIHLLLLSTRCNTFFFNSVTRHPVPAKRSFICRNSSRNLLDIRSLVPLQLGVDSLVDISGQAGVSGGARDMCRPLYQRLCRAKKTILAGLYEDQWDGLFLDDDHRLDMYMWSSSSSDDFEFQMGDSPPSDDFGLQMGDCSFSDDFELALK